MPASPQAAIPNSLGRALDLSSLTRRDDGSSGGGTPTAAAAVFDATDESFQTEVVEASRQVPIVLDFWAEWCQPCKQLSPLLEKLAAEAAGTWRLAKVDIEANPGLAGAFRIQSIPMVVAIAAAQPVDAFSGMVSEQQLRTWLSAVLEAAASVGVTGGGSQPQVQQPQVDERFLRATQAADAGEFDTAEQLFGQILAERPADDTATSGLAQVRLLRQVSELDADDVLLRAGAPESATASDLTPDTVATQCEAASLEFARGQVEPAFARLINVVRHTGGEERDRARSNLLDLFSILPAQDDRVRMARRNLSNVLF
ncbi:MAG TPA: tetratricopeptide repeat protein [Mycobacteriales bacterium]|nr:tetratricopeptide repeat protein [Mycobacteriales bacterium]